MLACMAGSGFVRNVGDVVEVPEDEASRLIEAGFASDAPKSPAVPTAPETGGTTDKKEEQTTRRGRVPASREKPVPPVVLAPAEPPAVESQPETVPAVAAPSSEATAAPTS